MATTVITKSSIELATGNNTIVLNGTTTSLASTGATQYAILSINVPPSGAATLNISSNVQTLTNASTSTMVFTIYVGNAQTMSVHATTGDIAVTGVVFVNT